MSDCSTHAYDVPLLITENKAPSSELYAMECTLEVSRRERLGEAETVKTCNWSGFASLEVVKAMFKMMREVVDE